jgi:bis(5'-nucleosyl)-tetraphosphatase (symmetrical)
MAVFAIGDVQGCYDELCRLLDKLDFDPGRDRLWFTGDLVNRGPKSLKVLRFVHKLGDSAVTVLGNHDLHLLAAAEHPVRRRSKDTLNKIYGAKDHPELLDWLRHRPMMHYDEQLDFVLVHAGLSPQWDLATALAAAAELEHVLRGDRYQKFLNRMYGNEPNRWSRKLKGWSRLRYITNCFTRMRYCDRNGRLELTRSGRPGHRDRKYLPWFRVPDRENKKLRIIFGHWSTLGAVKDKNIFPLDTGCVWGGALTALRLDGDVPERIGRRCKQAQKPR